MLVPGAKLSCATSRTHRMEALVRDEGWTHISAYKTLCRGLCDLYAASRSSAPPGRCRLTVAGSRLFAERVLNGVFAPKDSRPF
jgi:hypothetical protein